jgi:hypothetical protein
LPKCLNIPVVGEQEAWLPKCLNIRVVGEQEGHQRGCAGGGGQGSHPLLQVSARAHCNENPINVFLFWELRDLSPNFHIHVSVSDLYISRIGPHIFRQQNRQIDRWNM